jgi:hypothetical protein
MKSSKPGVEFSKALKEEAVALTDDNEAPAYENSIRVAPHSQFAPP